MILEPEALAFGKKQSHSPTVYSNSELTAPDETLQVYIYYLMKFSKEDFYMRSCFP
jgi:hypothetical protein